MAAFGDCLSFKSSVLDHVRYSAESLFRLSSYAITSNLMANLLKFFVRINCEFSSIFAFDPNSFLISCSFYNLILVFPAKMQF